MAQDIPIIDLANLVEVENVREHPEWISTAANIRKGLGTVGFMYLVNHGIPANVISNVFDQSQKFFALDEPMKLKYKKNTGVYKDSSDSTNNSKTFALDNYFGYTPPGGERLHPDAKFELKETYDWQHCRGVYPDSELPEFEKSISNLDVACKTFLKRKLLKLLAMSLEIENVDYFVNCCRHIDDPENYRGIYNMRILYYPPLANDDKMVALEEQAVRLGEHSDYGFLTLLFQDDTGGLEVKNVDGNWIPAKPLAGSILVNTGDLCEFWTRGIFPATPHRLAIPKNGDEKRGKSRYSVVFFNGPDVDTIVTPLKIKEKPAELERMSKNGKLPTNHYHPVNAYDYQMGRVAKQYS